MRELLPSFEVDLYEYKALPGFSMVAFERPMNSFHEIFQYDALHSLADWEDMHRQEAVHWKKMSLHPIFGPSKAAFPKGIILIF